MPITLKDVARQAGVHPSTVSRIVNNDPRLRVSPGTRARVKDLLRKTDYRPDAMARGLRMRQSQVLAVVIPDVMNPLFAGIFQGVEEAALEDGYNVILCSSDGQRARERDLLLALQARRIDGVILASCFLHDASVRWLRTQRIPHVLVNRFSYADDPFVGSDDEKGALLATRHLLELGHRRIAHLAASSRISTGVLRRRGFERALAEAGMEADPELMVETALVEWEGREAAERVLSARRPPTAIVAVNDMVALGVYDAAAARGMRIPDDVAVTGYNDMPMSARLRPGLTTVHVPALDLGRTSARMLVQQLEAGRSEPRRIVVEAGLVIRGSTDAKAV